MRFLRLAPVKNKDGEKTGTLNMILRERPYKYAPGSATDKVISKKRNIIVTGGHDSGKSRFMERIHVNAEHIWPRLSPYSSTVKGKRIKDPDKPRLDVPRSQSDWKFPAPVRLNAADPLSKWTEDHPEIAGWWESHDDNEGVEFRKLKAWQKADLLSRYVRERRAVVFVDDAHLLTAASRKSKIVKDCIMAAPRVVVTSITEGRLNPSIRTPLLDTDPEIIRLDTEAAYDITTVLMGVIIVIVSLISFGPAGVLAAIAMLKALSMGQWSARQA